MLIKQFVRGGASVVCLDVPKITNVANLVLRARMRVLMRIEVWASSRATLTQITVLMNVETVLLTWV